MIITPRFHLLELGDQPWCPEWLREYSHMARIQMWRTQAPGTKAPPAAQVCDILLDNLPNTASFDFIDSCAGGGGPIPIMEATLNERLCGEGKGPVRFILTDLYPSLEKWAAMAKRSAQISYIDHPVDATQANAVESADAFVISEMTNRNLSAFLNTIFIVLSPFLTTLMWFRHSPLHLFFTYVFPLVQLFFAVDGYVSCIRGRTDEELTRLSRDQPDLDVSGWEFMSGEDMVLPPFGKMYWYMEVKKSS